MRSIHHRKGAEVTDYKPEESVGYQLRKTARKMAHLLTKQIESENISIGMWYFLRALWQRDGVIQRELTDYVGLMQPTTVAALRGMQSHGLITMAMDKKDRRSVRVYLTKEGRRLKSRLLPRVAGINRIALRGISKDETAVFLRVLKTIYANAASAVAEDQSRRDESVSRPVSRRAENTAHPSVRRRQFADSPRFSLTNPLDSR